MPPTKSLKHQSTKVPKYQSPHLGPLERRIMQIFWKYPCSTVRSVQEQLSAENKKLAYTTVMTIMTRLVKKGALKREMDGIIIEEAFTSVKDISKKNFPFIHSFLLKNVYNSLEML